MARNWQFNLQINYSLISGRKVTILMKALIVDDEQLNRDGLRLQLEQSCPAITIIDDAASAKAAREKLAEYNYDILFLDINMPNESGFDLLESLSEKPFCVIFVTAYSEFAIRAFKANAIDYILKPVDTEELIAAVAKCNDRIERGIVRLPGTPAYSEIALQTQSMSYPSRLTLPHQQGFHIIETENIIWIEADGNYSLIKLEDNKQLLVTKAIREFEFLLDPSVFFRSHKSALINLSKIREYSSNDGHVATMNNGDEAPVSRRKLDEFMSAIDTFSKRV
jgi:two-component system LytT family response regulator